MKRLFCMLAVVILAAASPSAARRRNEPFVLHLSGSHDSIYPDSAVWRVRDPVRVIVTMINQSKHTVHYSLTSPGQDWQMDVRDSNGNPVGETEMFRRMKENIKNRAIVESRNMIGFLKPNGQAQDVIDVQMFYDLSRPGEYSIEVQRAFPQVARAPIKSNRLTLTITP
jgi:hypothetical protein